jgi:hypothetical protein
VEAGVGHDQVKAAVLERQRLDAGLGELDPVVAGMPWTTSSSTLTQIVPAFELLR